MIVHVVSPLNETPVFLFSPGPKRWKLWIEALSSTLILYVPALIAFRSLPAFSTSIEKPGRYTYQCDPHAARGMKGHFKVTA